MLEFPFPTFVTLYDNRFDNNTVDSSWIYIKDMSSPEGLASGQTAGGGKSVIDIQNVSDNGDIIRVYESYTKTEFKLDISGPAKSITLYRNATNTGDVGLDVDNYGDDIYLIPENLISESIYLRTYY